MKRVLFALCMLTLAVGCGGKTEKKSESTEEVAERTYSIGDVYRVGDVVGVVFDVTHGGSHGKVLSLDEVELSWAIKSQYYEQIETGALSMVDGKTNTQVIMSRGDHSAYPAFEWCANYGEGWYLPAIEELMVLYTNAEVLKKVDSALISLGAQPITYDVHWSSTDHDGYCAYAAFALGGASPSGKYNESSVRAVYQF